MGRDWVAEHLDSSRARPVEVHADSRAHSVPGADRLDAGGSGVTTVVRYGDNTYWSAAPALWKIKKYGHQDVRMTNGGRKEWLTEGRENSVKTRAPGRRLFERRSGI